MKIKYTICLLLCGGLALASKEKKQAKKVTFVNRIEDNDVEGCYDVIKSNDVKNDFRGMPRMAQRYNPSRITIPEMLILGRECQNNPAGEKKSRGSLSIDD